MDKQTGVFLYPDNCFKMNVPVVIQTFLSFLSDTDPFLDTLFMTQFCKCKKVNNLKCKVQSE